MDGHKISVTIPEDTGKPDFVSFHDDEGRLVFRIKSDANIELGDGVSLDDASERFWNIILHYIKQYEYGNGGDAVGIQSSE